TNAIEVTELRKVYRSDAGTLVQALDGVSFAVPQGRIHGLLGPNGAGKSTVVKILGTITAPTSGNATVLGFDVSRQPLAARRQMAVVLQQTAAETLLTVRDNLLIYAYLHGVSKHTAQRRLDAVIEEFELGARLRDTVQELSIGTKRRIQVAKIFMLDTPLIILDEATTGMDPLMKRRVMDRLRGEARKGRTILLTTQVLSEAEELCETIMILDRGRAMASGTLLELRKRAAHMFRVNLLFGGIDDGLVARLRALAPVDLQVDGKAVEMLFHGEEASLLEKLTDVSRAVPILQFEVRGPTLEEIFVTLVNEGR
ncbi:MAG TPA: ABC transporter ATP-binding protein, partial [Burkholderiaceae bacterium]|nr:ABC transporter ATP-binding protein [Burkholderiaceae bacterium]